MSDPMTNANAAHSDDGPKVSRREFVGALAGAGTAALAPNAISWFTSTRGQRADARDAVRAFLDARLPKREWIDAFLDPKARVWAKFDAETGYLLRNSFMKDGVDGSHTLARYEESGQRMQVNYRDQPCRINTYGNSFTQGHQVGDGETWQEILAAHFCEPIRNFGIGGFGVYQAYRRLRRIESDPELAAPYLIFNIWGDDHYRSVYSWRWLSFSPEACARMGPLMFHSNPWVHARLREVAGERSALESRPNICPRPESLYRLCDRDFVFATFEDDEVVRCLAAKSDHRVGLDREPLERMAAACGFQDLDLSTPEAIRRSSGGLLHAYAAAVGERILRRLATWCFLVKKKLFVLLSYPGGSIEHFCTKPANGTTVVDWHPQNIKEALVEEELPFVDTALKHVAEFETFKLSPKAYVDRYYMGHYNPRGNHFFAYAIKDELVAWLDPKPPSYLEIEQIPDQLKRFLPK